MTGSGPSNIKPLLIWDNPSPFLYNFYHLYFNNITRPYSETLHSLTQLPTVHPHMVPDNWAQIKLTLWSFDSSNFLCFCGRTPSSIRQHKEGCSLCPTARDHLFPKGNTRLYIFVAQIPLKNVARSISGSVALHNGGRSITAQWTEHRLTKVMWKCVWVKGTITQLH